MKKEDLVKLFVKLGCDEAFKKTNSKKKFVSLNRTEQADYLISVLSPKDAIIAPINEVTQSEMVELCPSAAQESTDDKRLFESWEELDDYLHSHYGYGVEIESSAPSTSDVNCLKLFYDNMTNL